jgi:hypothetical protein
MSRRVAGRDAAAMKKTLFISVIAVALLALALGGWTVKGVRRLGRGATPRLRPAYA